MYKIKEEIPLVKPIVDAKVKECIQKYIKTLGPDHIFALAIEFQNEYGALGSQIVENFNEFATVKTHKFNTKTQGHDCAYVLNNFRYTADL